MNHRRTWFRPMAAALLLVGLFAAQGAWAVEGVEEDPAKAPIGTLFRWLNFAIVFGGLGYVVARSAPAFFRARAAAISDAIAEAAAAKAEADERRSHAEEKLARLDQEVVELRVSARRDGAAEAERIRALTKQEAEKIFRAAQAEMEAAERAGRVELKSLAARLAVTRAEELLRKQMTTEKQGTLFAAFVDNLSRSSN